MRRTILVALAVVVSGGCYHATINTGIAPGTQQLQNKWATGFVYGLVPPATVEAMAACGNRGVARVETQLSFLNQLVSGLTFGIFTPMEITVTCGQGQEEDDLQQIGDAAGLQAALRSGELFVLRPNHPALSGGVRIGQ